MTAWAWGWVGFVAYFAVLEGVALWRSYRAKRAGAEDPVDTLSEHVWLWFGTGPRPKGPAVYLRRAVLVMALAWLAVHFVGGGEIV